MDEDNVWLGGRRQEQRALGRIIVTLQQRPDAQAVRGAGVQARDNSEEPADATTVRSQRMPRGNPDNLRAAAQRKSEAAAERADKAIRELIKRGEPVTFRTVARVGGVSADFL